MKKLLLILLVFCSLFCKGQVCYDTAIQACYDVVYIPGIKYESVAGFQGRWGVTTIAGSGIGFESQADSLSTGAYLQLDAYHSTFNFIGTDFATGKSNVIRATKTEGTLLTSDSIARVFAPVIIFSNSPTGQSIKITQGSNVVIINAKLPTSCLGRNSGDFIKDVNGFVKQCP